MIKKIISLLVISFLVNSCLVLKVEKDSPPLIDAGIPIIGHYRNKDTVKAVLYTVIFASSFLGMILFSPTTDNNETFFGLQEEVRAPVFYSLVGLTTTSFVASSIDTAATYHYVNNKIIDLNDIEWEFSLDNSKYDVIMKFREETQNISDVKNEKELTDEIKYYQKKLIDGTITDDELFFIEHTDVLRDNLEKELGLYYISKDLE